MLVSPKTGACNPALVASHGPLGGVTPRAAEPLRSRGAALDQAAQAVEPSEVERGGLGRRVFTVGSQRVLDDLEGRTDEPVQHTLDLGTAETTTVPELERQKSAVLAEPVLP